MHISVEISTFNNKELLRDVLDRLARQTLPPDRFDVVLSDDGSSDGLVEMARTLADDLPYALTILENGHRGGSYAHNAGIRACRGEIVVMLAADILATPELLEGHARVHREHPAEEVVAVGRLQQSPTLPANAVQQGWNVLVDRLFETPKDDIQHGGFLVSNLSFKKAFMLRHGLFREWPAVAQEDMELGYRLRQQGMRIVQCPVGLGYHHHVVTLRGLACRAYMQGYNYHYLEDNVPEFWIRQKTGHVGRQDGLGRYLRNRLKGAARRLLVNGWTLHGLMLPLIARAERVRALRALTPSLCGKVSLYHFHLGLRDYENGRPLDLERVAIR